MCVCVTRSRRFNSNSSLSALANARTYFHSVVVSAGSGEKCWLILTLNFFTQSSTPDVTFSVKDYTRLMIIFFPSRMIYAGDFFSPRQNPVSRAYVRQPTTAEGFLWRTRHSRPLPVPSAYQTVLYFKLHCFISHYLRVRTTDTL